VLQNTYPHVVDGYNGLDQWAMTPKDPTGHCVRPYDPNAGQDKGPSTKISWEIIDPDMEGLPECAMARLRQAPLQS